MSEYLHDIGVDDSSNFIKCLNKIEQTNYSKLNIKSLSRQIIDELYDVVSENSTSKSFVAIILRELLHVKWMNENLVIEKDKLQSNLLVMIMIIYLL